MAMKNPAHPGLLIKDSLDALDVSVSDAADALGVTRQQLHNVIAGRSALSPEMAMRLERAIGSTADFWLRSQVTWDLAQLQHRADTLNVRSLLRA